MALKSAGPGFYEFLIEAELQQYYNAFKNDLKVQNVAQLKYVSEDDMSQIGMSRPEMRRLTKYFNKHCPQTYLAKMKKKFLYRRDETISVTTLGNNNSSITGRTIRSVAPGRHIIQADAIVSHKTLGSGEFGTVQQGVWTSDDGERIQVAIKCLSQERMENNPVEFLKEAAIMHTVDHEHIVRLYGVVLDTSSLVLVTELAPLRSLLECLKEPSMRPNLTVQTLFDFSVQIGDGMQYLESKRLIHRDLAARNILVFSRSKVKISDFGLSRALGVGKDYYQTNFNVNLKLPIAWCAPECINFLRFTSASDVWAYGVTLWEMFSYGFQPWAALTGQQILEAIDEPNYQRLERPECCPVEIYYQIMIKCWQHEPQNRPTFAQLLNLLPECKPELVQAIRESESKSRRDVLSFDAGDLITIIDKKPLQGNPGSGNSGDESNVQWKGVLKCGKSGIFNPGNTITYLGSSLPCVKETQGAFNRNDSRSSSLKKGRLSADMISSPQGDLKHTGHVGPDGQFFGDIAFMNSKCWVPRQVVPPYKPESPVSTDTSACSTPSSRFHSLTTKGHRDSHSEILSSDTAPLLAQSQKNCDSSLQKSRKKFVLPTNGNHGLNTASVDSDPDHEYHEISDEENEIMISRANGNGAVGLSNPALSSKSQSPLDSPRFEKTFDLGPSLMDEVFGALERDHHNHEHADEANVKNELREIARHKKKFATVKPISSKDRKTLDNAIAIANELASRSMLDLDRHGRPGHNSNSFDDISSPRTPTSPTHRKKFSFMIGSNKNERERRNYSQEAASIPDIQSTLTEEAKEAYNSLIDKPSSVGSLGFLTPSFENKSSSFHFPEKCSSLSKKSAFFDNEPLSPPPLTSSVFQSSSPTASALPPTSNIPAKRSGFIRSHSKSLSCTADLKLTDVPIEVEEEIDGNPLRLLRQNKVPNVLPLPPRQRRKFGSSKSFDGTISNTPASQTTVQMTLNHSALNQNLSSGVTRHQRKHPLLIPGKVSMPLHELESSEVSRAPPPPPPKPLRQNLSSLTKQIAQPETPRITASATEILHESICSIVEIGNPTTEIGQDSTLLKNHTTSTTNDDTVEGNENERAAEVIFSHVQTPKLQCKNNEIENEISNSDQFYKKEGDEVDSPILDFNERRRCFEVKTEEIYPKSFSQNEVCRNSEIDFGIQSSRKQTSESSEGLTETETFIQGQAAVSQCEKIGLLKLNFDASSASVVVGEDSLSNDTHETTSKSEPVEVVRQSEDADTKIRFRCSPSKDAILFANPLKIRTVQRILGASATEKECIWALDICRDDCAHAVKLLRLKSLLPESLLQEDIERVISVLEMSHWDVARASSFLLNTANQNTRNRTSLRKLHLTSSEETQSNFERSTMTLSSLSSNSSGSSENGNIRNCMPTSCILGESNLSDIANSNKRKSSESSDGLNSSGTSYIRPTRV